MDLIQGYGSDSDGKVDELDGSDDCKPMCSAEICRSLAINKANLVVAPTVLTKNDIGGVSCVNPFVNEIKCNPKYDELFQPIVGFSLFFKTYLLDIFFYFYCVMRIYKIYF